MKAIKINTEVDLTNGIQLPSGVIVLFSSAYLYPNEDHTKSLAEISIKIYGNLTSYQNGFSAIRDTKDISSNIYPITLKLSDLHSENGDMITSFLNIVKTQLEGVYPNSVEIITI
jgi:hypothetical protein